MYKFRNFPCNIVPEKELWAVSGTRKDDIGNYMTGVLEWCVNEADAEYIRNKMMGDYHLFDLKIEKFIKED